jgi:hypothetical protein
MILALLPYWLPPIAFVLACLALATRGPATAWQRGGILALIAYCISLAIGTCTILESRSSTAGIGFVFLPVLATGPGVLGLLLGSMHFLHRHRENSKARSAFGALSILSAAALGLVIGLQAVEWVETRSLNEKRDAESHRHRLGIEAAERRLTKQLSANPGQEERIIAEIAGNRNERAVLIPIARNRFTPPEVLAELSRSSDLGVALSALRNARIPADAIEWVYANHPYPQYFYSTMAANPNTAPHLLRVLLQKRHLNTGIAPALAANPASPADIIGRLMDRPNARVARGLARNPALDCQQLQTLLKKLDREDAGTERPDVVATIRQRLHVCPPDTATKP